jgi:microsomal dipeptidase-like Zn-dependent dipeptidase
MGSTSPGGGASGRGEERTDSAKEEIQAVKRRLLAHVAAFGWEHIGLTADYAWTARDPAAPFRQRDTMSGSEPEGGVHR